MLNFSSLFFIYLQGIPKANKEDLLRIPARRPPIDGAHEDSMTELRSFHLTRFNELINLVTPHDDFFKSFHTSGKDDPEKNIHFQAYEQALSLLDEQSWAILKKKATDHYLDHRDGQHKQGFFNQLNEALAYKHLHDIGGRNIRFVPENGEQPTPDIEYEKNNEKYYCEVKTLCISDDEINRRTTITVIDGSIDESLSDGFLNKFLYNVKKAMDQIQKHSDNASQKGIVYQILNFNDFTLTYLENYQQQLIQYSNSHNLGRLEFSKAHIRTPVAIVYLD